MGADFLIPYGSAFVNEAKKARHMARFSLLKMIDKDRCAGTGIGVVG